MPVRIGLVGAGKMGISHLAIANAQPDASVVAVCDTSRYVLSVLRKYAGVETYRDFGRMLDRAKLDALIVATPTRSHFALARRALERGLHVFVEKPLTLSAAESRALADLAIGRRLVNQVGFHNRFIGTFQEAARLARAGAVGAVSEVRGTAYGQVVVKEAGRTWRSRKAEGGGCLHDYASHVVDLMNFLAGPPAGVSSARLTSIYSRDVEDAVEATFEYPGATRGSFETNWSDARFRKMTTTVTLTGAEGRIVADRQELKVELRRPFESYPAGATSRYITHLQKPVGFYLRGEEYSAQIEAFVAAIREGRPVSENSFASAWETDRVLELVQQRGGDAVAAA